MDEYKTLLRSKLVILTKGLDTAVVPYKVYELGGISAQDLERIDGKTSSREKAEELVNSVSRKGRNAFDCFVQVLSELDHQKHLADVLRIPEPISELGTKPKQGQPYRPVFDHRDVDTMYAIRNLPPRGLCLIVNNYDFPGSSLSKRKGAEKDKQPLLDLFDCLGFEVMYKQNLPAVDVVEAVQELVGRSRGHDCAVVFLMSHGKEGAVFGADARPVYMSNIIGILSTALSPGKPKLLIVQACRVVEDQPAGVGPSHDPHWQDTHLESRPTAPSYQFADGVEADSQNSSQYQVSQSISRQSSSMQFADMLMAFSTLPGTPSFRNEGTGSWFVQALVEVFHKYAHSEDLIRLFVRINMAVATRLSQNGEPQQVPAPMLTLTKLLYLRPIKPFYS